MTPPRSFSGLVQRGGPIVAGGGTGALSLARVLPGIGETKAAIRTGGAPATGSNRARVRQAPRSGARSRMPRPVFFRRSVRNVAPSA